MMKIKTKHNDIKSINKILLLKRSMTLNRFYDR